MEGKSATLDAIERQQWLEPVEERLQTAVSGVYKAAGAPGQAVRNFLHGKWLGHPLHPVLTDVPLGAWTAALVLDLMEAGGARQCREGADLAVKVGLAGAAAAAVTGFTDWNSTDGKARRIGLVHGLVNLTSAGLYAASLACRARRDRAAGRTLACLGYAVSAGAAYLGGHLVFSKSIGVNHIEPRPAPGDWVSVLAESELGEGAMTRVEANGYRILLARREGRLHAIAELCSHLGGPLAEGSLEDGSVRCPWHGSRFSLEDGSVEDGPATQPQSCFETRVREGRIEVRARKE